jgi:diacylglycerol kinase family enzyme
MVRYVVVYSPNVDLESLKATFAAHKATPKFLVLSDDLAPRLKKEVSSGSRIFIAAGGDGTVNSLVNALAGLKFQLGLIPTGTHNHLAKDLNVPLKVDEAVEVILRGKTKQIDVAAVNDQLFLNNSSIGIYPHIVSRRHNVLGSFVKRLSDLINLPGVLVRPRKYKVDIKIDNRSVSASTSLIFIGNNSYKIHRLGLSKRDSLTGGRLSLYFIKSHNGLKIIWVSAKGVLGKARGEKLFSEYFASQIVIDAKPAFLKVALDGEVRRLKTPLVYKIMSKKISVIVP